DITFLPAGFSGDPAALPATLTLHAGEVDFSDPGTLAASDLGVRPKTDAIIASARYRISEGLEGYVEGVALRNKAESRDDSLGKNGFATVRAPSPANPFTENIILSFPILQMGSQYASRYDSRRYTAGLVADLPFGWRGTVDTSWGGFRVETVTSFLFGAEGLF